MCALRADIISLALGFDRVKVLVGKDADVIEGRLKGFEVNGRKYVIGRHRGRLFAMDGRCSHAGFDLAYGTVRDGTVICPAHGAAFDIIDGRKVAHSGAKDLRVYIVLVEGEDVYVDV